MITIDPILDGLSPKGNEPPQGGGVNLYLKILGIHNSGGPRSYNRTRVNHASPGRTHQCKQNSKASGAYALVPKLAFGRAAQGHGAYTLALCHFRSALRLLNPEILERTHQGIVRNGKRFKTQ
ncbi:hypothetical protein PIB30_023618 [Stylosanthes scabra]|uniref:Uncharacterized protein n=1 Tax=Stylosanthes scabra TaxID=79078 RepID=A0ABU6Z9U3_9FABA|nr:hypothetical protein [Stylosanthes scabra]